ncbi:MAG: hypothetical protein PHU23_02175 [Dehalococcoidales bacterium]|nr:hypothetical protein [Dehalococcoidales bacterium]
MISNETKIGDFITITMPNGMTHHIKFDDSTRFEPYMTDSMIDYLAGTIEEYKICNDKYLQEKIEARPALKAYILKWWDDIGKHCDNPPMVIGDFQDIVRAFVNGWIAKATGEIDLP